MVSYNYEMNAFVLTTRGYSTTEYVACVCYLYLDTRRQYLETLEIN